MVNPDSQKLSEFDIGARKLRSTRGKLAQEKQRLGHEELQLKIGKHIIKNKIKSSFDISHEFGISKYLANKTCGRMERKELIVSVEEKSVSGGSRQYFNFTQKGVSWILDKGDLDFDEFWDLLFLIYNENYNLRGFEQIETTIKKYEELKNIKREYFFPYDNFYKLANIRNIIKNERQFYEILKPILSKNLKNIEQQIDKNILEKLDFRIILNYSFNKNSNKSTYYFTPFGDMLLLYFAYEKITKQSKFNFNSIPSKFKKKYPLVFSHWDLIKKITKFNDSMLIHCFLNLHVRDPQQIFDQHKSLDKTFGTINHDEDVELLRLFYYMQRHMKFQFKNEFDSAQTGILNWAQKNHALRLLFNSDKHPSKHIKSLAWVGINKSTKTFIKKSLAESSEFNQSLLQNREKYLDSTRMEKMGVKLSNNEKEFLKAYRNEPNPTSKTIKTVMKSILPISKYAELYNYMVVRDVELYFSQDTKKFFTNKIYFPLYNIMSFQFFLVLKLSTSHKTWRMLMKRREMQSTKKWFDDWVNVITSYYTNRLDQISNNEYDEVEFFNLANPVYPESLLIPEKPSIFSDLDNIQNS